MFEFLQRWLDDQGLVMWTSTEVDIIIEAPTDQGQEPLFRRTSSDDT